MRGLGRSASIRLVVSVAAMTLSPSPAGAKNDPTFVLCDGYSAPKNADDQILGHPYGPTSPGAAGSQYCDAALADPRLLDSFWVRRAHLYQAKAIHQIAMGNFGEALRQLDLSDKTGAGHGDVWFDGSVAIGNRLLRAVALYRLGRPEEGRKELETATAARRYAPSVAGLARSIETLFDYDRGTFARLMTRDAPLAPTLVRSMFWAAIYHDDYADALKISGQVSFDLPKGHGRWSFTGEENYAYDLIKDRAEFAGGVAYAELAMGKRDEARRTIADAREDIADSLALYQPSTGGKKLNDRQERDWFERRNAADAATRQLDSWERWMTLRDKVAGKSLAAATTMVSGDAAEQAPVLTDILRQVSPANDAERQSVAMLLRRMEATKDLLRRKALSLDLSQLIARLPQPELPVYRPKMRREGGFMRSGDEGFMITPDAADGLVGIRFGTTLGSRAMVEEAALLEAAEYARSQGKDAFIIDSGGSVERKTTFVGGRSQGTYSTGYEMQLRIRPVTAAALPPSLEAERWRLIRADDVIAGLEAKYLAAAPAK